MFNKLIQLIETDSFFNRFNEPVLEIRSCLKDRNTFLKTSSHGYTPLLLAVSKGNNSIVQYLIKAYVDILANDNNRSKYLADFLDAKVNGKTPLMIAAEDGKLEIIKLLISAGANPFELNGNKGAIDYANEKLSGLRNERNDLPACNEETDYSLRNFSLRIRSNKCNDISQQEDIINCIRTSITMSQERKVSHENDSMRSGNNGVESMDVSGTDDENSSTSSPSDSMQLSSPSSTSVASFPTHSSLTSPLSLSSPSKFSSSPASSSVSSLSLPKSALSSKPKMKEVQRVFTNFERNFEKNIIDKAQENAKKIINGNQAIPFSMSEHLNTIVRPMIEVYYSERNKAIGKDNLFKHENTNPKVEDKGKRTVDAKDSKEYHMQHLMDVYKNTLFEALQKGDVVMSDSVSPRIPRMNPKKGKSDCLFTLRNFSGHPPNFRPGSFVGTLPAQILKPAKSDILTFDINNPRHQKSNLTVLSSVSPKMLVERRITESMESAVRCNDPDFNEVIMFSVRTHNPSMNDNGALDTQKFTEKDIKRAVACKMFDNVNLWEDLIIEVDPDFSDDADDDHQVTVKIPFSLIQKEKPVLRKFGTINLNCLKAH